MLKWESHYELGIESIDNQHKKLLEIAGELSDLLTNAIEGDDIYDEMVRIVDELTQYTVYHFAFEEKIFEAIGYGGAEKHIEEHRKLVKEIEGIDLRAIDEDQVAHGKKILNFLITWVFKHISGSDFLYRDQFIAHGIR